MRANARKPQGGAVLLEALIAILIFSVGLLGIIGLQAQMIVETSESRYRNEASFYVNTLLGEMWGADRSSTDEMAKFATGGEKYKVWYAAIKNTNISSGLLGLPGADKNAPEVNVTPVKNTVSGFPVSYDVAVTVYWQTPGQDRHKHVVAASITAD